MDDDASRRAPGGLEAEVLAALWAARTPLTPVEVRDHLTGDLAYSTVATILARLHAKGVLVRVKTGRAYTYTPVADEPGVAARRMRRVLDEREDRDTVLARFVSDLSASDEALLRTLLEGR
ncbi:BlaI/MecI/CopY family transcriptional regulator [Actinosynnema sp. NPDC020468]|uniref:BlaI/MecI/CopY family transcriptional regulator n=1 Tax=Actinosynnema sp. NPDC020468 TaxID=3154488 RepID=UPI0033FF75C8